MSVDPFTPGMGWPIPTPDTSTEIWDPIRDLGNAIDGDLTGLLDPDDTWTNMGLGGNFNAVSGFTPMWKRVGPFVFVRGMVSLGGATFFGLTMASVPPEHAPGTAEHYRTTKVQSDSSIVQLQITTSGAINCPGSTYATSQPGAGRAIAINGMWLAAN